MAARAKNFPFFRLTDPVVAPLFVGENRGSAAFKNATRQFSEGALEPFPGVFSTEAWYLAFLDELSRVLTSKLPDSTDEFGRVGANGVRGNFYGLRHLAGFPMIPATWPLASNKKKRADLGLADGPINEKHALIFRAVIRLFFSDLENQGLKIAKGTSTGIPFFKTDMASKLEIAMRAMEDAPTAGKLMLEGRYEDAFVRFSFGGAYYVVYREQTSDGIKYEKGVWVSKDRMVAPFDYAISGGDIGELIVASKDPQRVRDAGVKVPQGFFCTRRRTAMACPFTVNAVLMVVAQSVRVSIYDKFAFSLHHTTRADKQRKVRQWEMAIATDVSDHDTLWPGWLRDMIASELLAMGFADWWVAIFKTTMQLPVYVSAPAPGEGSTLLGDWRHPDLEVGLPSGVGFTDLMGSILMVSTYAILQLDHTAEHLWARVRDLPSAMSFMSSYLKGQEEIAQMSKSDDALLGWKLGRSLEKAKKLLELLKEGRKDLSPYMVISYEHGGAFLGDVLVYDHTKELKNARFMGNIISYVTNMFAPEYGVESNKPDRSKRRRPFPGLAVPAAPIVYGDCPVYNDVNSIIEELWHKHRGESFRLFRERMYEEDKIALSKYVTQRAELKDVGALSTKDYEVLADKTKLAWKFLPSEIHPAVVELVTSGIDPEKTQQFFDQVISGVKHGN